ncbi:MAG: hypothetical protein JSS67_02345 [Bacteroidetes bacterium]|nr:hypothetical protein [Bacteroidota bacterium]
MRLKKGFISSIFYGNYFYGICTVSLCIESNMQQGLPLNSILFYFLVYFGTIIYYNMAYLGEVSAPYDNERTQWYATNRKWVLLLQWIYITSCAIAGCYLMAKYFRNLHYISLSQFTLLIFAGIIAILYYGISLGKNIHFNVRDTGWIKPFIIGLVWATAVSYIPILWYEMEHGVHYAFSWFNLWFWGKNFMFISLLAILFDIKDYIADHNRKLKTFVVRIGLRKTIFYIIIPLALIGFISFMAFAFLREFHPVRILINCIPFIMLIIVSWSMQKKRSILFYLTIIDGLMVLKAACGIMGILLTPK